VRRTLARRELNRRGVAADTSDDRLNEALVNLNAALIALLPDMPSCRHADQRSGLAQRITVGTTSTADLAVLTALPPDALAVLGMTPAKFVTSPQSIDDRF
jgi:hypothetical protein